MRRTAALVLAIFAAACGDEKTTGIEPPVAKFTATQSTVRPQVFQLDASASFTGAGAIKTWVWSFGDEAGGAPTELTTPTAVHAYAAAGEYTITLVVRDEQETESEPVTQKVTVSAVNTELPKAKIDGPGTGAPGKALTFDASGSTPAEDLRKFAWDFGDPGSNDANKYEGPDARTASHVFSAAGSYRVSLTVTDSLGQSDTAELLVAVGGAGPIAVCNWTPQPALQGIPVKFDASQSTVPAGSSIALYVWDPDDGSPEKSGKTIEHTYNVQATFKPKLKIIDDQNRIATANCPEVVVQPPPLCEGDYSMTANPSQQQCSLSPVTWAGVKLSIKETSDGKISASETWQGNTIHFNGTWSGPDFTMTGTYDESSGGFTITTDATIKGTFTGCSGWKGTWVEKKRSDFGELCTLTWNVTGSRL